MIAPRTDVELRSMPPAAPIPAFHFLIGWIIAPLTRRRMAARAEARMERVSAIEIKVRECQTRESLESLLGPPRYAMSGDAYSSISADQSNVLRPDLVEVYNSDGCIIALQFKGGRITSATGWPAYTTWEKIALATDGKLRRQARMPKRPADDASA